MNAPPVLLDSPPSSRSPLWTISLAVLGILFAVWLIVSALLYLAQDRLLFPRPNAVNLPPSGIERHEGFSQQTLKTADGLMLTFWAAPPRPGMPTIIDFHGNGLLATWDTRYLEPLHIAGYGLVLAEYRGYGGNPGYPSEKGILVDSEGYYDWVENHDDHQLPIVFGESLGTGVAVDLAVHRHIRALILDSPFTSIAEVVRSGTPFFWAPTFLLRNRFDSLSKIDQVKAPLLVLHGHYDRLIKKRLSSTLFAAAGCPVKMVNIADAGHLVLASDLSGAARQDILGFMANLPADGLCPVEGS